MNPDYHYCFGRYAELSDTRPDFFNIEERFKHLYLVGLSGMGKSTVMENLAEYDISQGYSVIYIDPKGESAQKLYFHFKDNSKVRYVSYDNPLVINLFDKKGYDLETLIDEFVQIIDNVVAITSSNPSTTVRMKEIVVQALYSLQPEDLNFQTLYHFLSNQKFRDSYNFTTEALRTWWIELFDIKKTDNKKRSDYSLSMASVSNRIFLAMTYKKTSSFINGTNELDIIDLVRNGESLIINIKSSTDFNKVFVSNLIVGAILSYMSLEKKNQPLFVFIDEFDLVASSMFADLLQLGRSSNVGFTIAHQNFSSARSETHKRMMSAIIETILGAVSNYVVFNTSPTVARVMCDVFNLKVSDFTELGKYEARIKLETNKNHIYTRLPVLQSIPDDFVFPVKNKVKVSPSIDFLDDVWIMI